MPSPTARRVNLSRSSAWDDDLLSQARGYVSAYRRALEGPDGETRIALLAMDTLTIRVGTTTDEVHGLVLLPTHPLRLAWVAAHDQLLRGWAEETARVGKTPPGPGQPDRTSDLISRLSPANLPFITVDPDGKPFVYAEELTHGSALYLPPTTDEPQSDANVICRVIDVATGQRGTHQSPPTRSVTASAVTAVRTRGQRRCGSWRSTQALARCCARRSHSAGAAPGG